MKAVYETPRVSFEAFAANNAISACIDPNTKFDCVMDSSCNDINRYFASALGINFCKNKTSLSASFADYADITKTPNDNISTSMVDISDSIGYDGHTNNNGDALVWTDYSVDVKNKDGFLGWLYLGCEGNSHYGKKKGWEIDDKQLEYKDSDANSKLDLTHAWLAPVFRTKATSV